MSLWRDTPELPWAVESDSPLRLVAGWSEKDTEALEVVAWLGRSLAVSVQVVAAVPPPSMWKTAGNYSSKKLRKLVHKESDTFIRHVRSTLKSHVDKENWAEDPARLVTAATETRALMEAANDAEADLLVLGSRSKKPKSSVFPSSMIDTLLAGASAPIAVGPRNPKMSKKGITRVSYVFLGSDGFDHCFGLEHATHLAARLEVPIRLVAVSPDSPKVSDFDVSVDSPRAGASWYESALSRLDVARDFVIDMAADSPGSPVVEVEVAVGSGWRQAVHSVKWKKGDLACLTYRGEHQFKRVFSASPTAEFLRHATTPALIFPPPSA